jgi:outer membrane murein-binding lipoprotein Lpp
MNKLTDAAKESVMYVAVCVGLYGARVARVQNNELSQQIESLRADVNNLKKKRGALMSESDMLAHPERIKRLVVKLKLGLRPVE